MKRPTSVGRLQEIISGYESELKDFPPEVVGVNDEVVNWLKFALKAAMHTKVSL